MSIIELGALKIAVQYHFILLKKGVCVCVCVCMYFIYDLREYTQNWTVWEIELG